MFLVACTNCSSFVWYIMGLVWRLNGMGRYAAGDIIDASWTDAQTAAGQKTDAEAWEAFLATEPTDGVPAHFF
jgi:hypothetical protein